MNALPAASFDDLPSAGAQRFRYRAVDRSGKVVAGTLASSSRQSALIELEGLSLMPVEIGEERPAHRPRTVAALFSRNPRPGETTDAIRDLATLLDAGVNLDKALLAVGEGQDLPAVSAMMRQMNSAVSAGRSLAEAMAEHPKCFPPQHVKMVEVAEAKGRLGETLGLIAHERSRSEALRRRVVSALAYPAFLFVAAAGVLAFVLVSVIPEFERAFQGFGGQAGSQAEAIFALSQAFRQNAPMLAALACLALLAGLAANRSPKIRGALFSTLAMAPGVRQAAAYRQTAVVCSTLSALLSSGVDISSSLRLVRGLVQGRRAAEGLDRTVRDVRRGVRLSDALREAGILPGYAAHMLHVGESSGETAAALARIAKTYEERLDRSLARLAAIIGPVVLVGVSVMIAWIIVSVMTALLSMNDLLVS